MSTTARRILDHLKAVEALRAQRALDPGFSARVQAVKTYQHARFESTYADLLAEARYRDAARFFLDDLYGPHDFTERDAQFARVVPAIVRLFPADIVETVAALAELHALSEDLDNEMARHGTSLTDIQPEAYAQAWRATGRAPDRARQIRLMSAIGDALSCYTARPLLRATLRMMRRPAAAAGLGRLQDFLETGFDTFGAMGTQARTFLDTIVARERGIAETLFGFPLPDR